MQLKHQESGNKSLPHSAKMAPTGQWSFYCMVALRAIVFVKKHFWNSNVSSGLFSIRFKKEAKIIRGRIMEQSKAITSQNSPIDSLRLSTASLQSNEGILRKTQFNNSVYFIRISKKNNNGTLWRSTWLCLKHIRYLVTKNFSAKHVPSQSFTKHKSWSHFLWAISVTEWADPKERNQLDRADACVISEKFSTYH